MTLGVGVGVPPLILGSKLSPPTNMQTSSAMISAPPRMIAGQFVSFVGAWSGG